MLKAIFGGLIYTINLEMNQFLPYTMLAGKITANFEIEKHERWNAQIDYVVLALPSILFFSFFFCFFLF